MKILIVPDVHGRTFWRKAKEIVTEYQKIIFLGDYLDPYKQEGITPEQAFIEFLDIIEFKKKFPDKVVLLLGNHDLHYYFPGFIPSSRMNYFGGDKYCNVFKDNKELFTFFTVIKTIGHKWLFSHAGITTKWLKNNNLKLTKLLKMSSEELLDQKGRRWGGILEQVSFWRGGEHMNGSPVWADSRELCENALLNKKITQVVGHNQVAEILSFEGVVLTDCKKLIVLDTKTKELSYETKD